MTKILIFTDFDGTITGREGLKTVLDDFYQSLMVGYIAEKRQNYKMATLQPSEEVQKIFEKKFGKYTRNFNYGQKDADILMSANAVAFFKQAVNNPAVTVKIITKNRQDYIQEVLKYHGFTQEEISKIIIDDTGHKERAVHESLNAEQNSEPKPSHIYILDDNESDFGAMVTAAESPKYGYQAEQIKKYNQKPGQFQWAQYQQEIHALFPTPVEEHPMVVTPTIIKTNNTSTKKKGDTVTDKDHQAHSPEDNHQQRASEHISQVISLDQLNAERAFKITGSSFAAGFFVGLLISVVLIVTGALAPLGISVIGLVALSIATASGLGLISGATAFAIAKGTEAKELPQNNEQLSLNDSTQHLQGLGGPANKAPSQDAHVAHFPGIIGRPTQQNSENCSSTQQEQEHYDNSSVGPK